MMNRDPVADAEVPWVGILLYRSVQGPRDVFAEDKYRLLAVQLVEAGFVVRTLTYEDARREELRSQLLACRAVLVWINPIEPGLDRPVLDALLREVAAAGVLVSAHPDVILKIGTKEVLVATQSVGWTVETIAYRTAVVFRQEFPGRLRRDGVRVLKQCRGNGGQGVWKVSANDQGAIVLWSAARGAQPEILGWPAVAARFESEVFARGDHLIDQAWIPTIRRGMVRAYLCGAKVVGFGYQEVNALYPVEPDDDFTRRRPSSRHYYSEECPFFQLLRRRLENEWVPALQRDLPLEGAQLPLLWDADFFMGDSPGREYLLCEINASCVSPFPESAITPLIRELRHRLEASPRKQPAAPSFPSP